MLKKTITYTDFNGNEVSEDFFFNLSKLELSELEMSVDGGFAEYIKTLVPEDQDPNEPIKIDARTREIWNIVKLLVDTAYGVKSEDGKRFRKTEEDLQAFRESNAYSEFIMELAENPDKVEEFVNAVVPSNA